MLSKQQIEELDHKLHVLENAYNNRVRELEDHVAYLERIIAVQQNVLTASITYMESLKQNNKT